MLKRIILSLLIAIFIGTIAFIVISYSRGYRFNFGEKTLTTTGILSASSFPDKASIWVNDKLLSATSASLSLTPGWYDIKISKEGYQAWQKNMKIQGEVVTTVDALLIPNTPSLSALTVNGIINPSLSPSGTRVAYMMTDTATPSGTIKTKAGIWIQELRTGTLGGKTEPRQIFQSSVTYPWNNAAISWSPDEQTIIVIFSGFDTKTKNPVITRVLQFDTDTLVTTPIDITNVYTSLQEDWEQEKEEKEIVTLTALPKPVSDILLKSASDIRFSPDETKILYKATGSAVLSQIITPALIGSNTTEEVRSLTPGMYYIYDRKEDKNFLIADAKVVIRPEMLIWYTDSKHVAMVEKDTIYISDYDGTNKRAVYAGPFDPSVIYAWPAGQRLVIWANFGTRESTPNLYLIDLS